MFHDNNTLSFFVYKIKKIEYDVKWLNRKERHSIGQKPVRNNSTNRTAEPRGGCLPHQLS